MKIPSFLIPLSLTLNPPSAADRRARPPVVTELAAEKLAQPLAEGPARIQAQFAEQCLPAVLPLHLDGTERTLRDDGQGADPVAGGGRFAAIIPLDAGPLAALAGKVRQQLALLDREGRFPGHRFEGRQPRPATSGDFWSAGGLPPLSPAGLAPRRTTQERTNQQDSLSRQPPLDFHAQSSRRTAQLKHRDDNEAAGFDGIKETDTRAPDNSFPHAAKQAATKEELLPKERQPSAEVAHEKRSATLQVALEHRPSTGRAPAAASKAASKAIAHGRNQGRRGGLQVRAPNGGRSSR